MTATDSGRKAYEYLPSSTISLLHYLKELDSNEMLLWLLLSHCCITYKATPNTFLEGHLRGVILGRLSGCYVRRSKGEVYMQQVWGVYAAKRVSLWSHPMVKA